MLSVVITAWNEEKNLPRVVQSVASFADEVIVVDTQSTDKTVEIAKSLKCKVFHHQNTSVVEPVRNFSISKAKGDWILLLDADEEVSSSLASQLLEIVKSDSADYVRIPRKNIIFGQWIKTSHWWPDYVYRFFKKGHVEWDEKIHSIPLIVLGLSITRNSKK
jgi:glycosyltransferase involved in cell wall biosynthesis